MNYHNSRSSHSHETLPSSELAHEVPETEIASKVSAEVVAPKNHARGQVTAALTGAIIGVSSLFSASPGDAAAPKQTDAQVLAGSKSEKKEENAAVRNLAPSIVQLEGIADIKKQLSTGKLVKVKDGKDYTLHDIGIDDPNIKNRQFYATLRSHTKKLLDKIAADFSKKFGKKLRVSSLSRTKELVMMIRENGNTNASLTSTHMYGTTFDFTKNGMSQAELEWMRVTLANMERSGKIVATEEWAQPCFHIVDIRANEK